jgi:hypothetical protein
VVRTGYSKVLGGKEMGQGSPQGDQVLGFPATEDFKRQDPQAFPDRTNTQPNPRWPETRELGHLGAVLVL